MTPMPGGMTEPLTETELAAIRERHTLSVATEMTEELAVERFGYQWWSWFGIPIKGTPCYPKSTRVRQLMSPGQIEHPRWKEYWAEHDGRPADGDEPLSYAYCSMGDHPAELPSLRNERKQLLETDIPRLLAEIDRLKSELARKETP